MELIIPSQPKLSHIQLVAEYVSLPWAKVWASYLEAMYEKHPDWLADELTFRLRCEFAQVNRVDIQTENQPMYTYLTEFFGKNRQWLPLVNRPEQVPYYRGFGPQAVVELNHSCEFCGNKGHAQVFGSGSVGWWVVQCDQTHTKSELVHAVDLWVDVSGKVNIEGYL